MDDKYRKLYKILKNILRISIAAGIIGGLIWYRREQFSRCLELFDSRFMIPAILVYLFHIAVCAWRWHKLTVITGYKLSRFEAFSLTMQGNFFSLIIPGGAIGGDMIKMGILANRTTRGCRTEGIFTILMDRIIGMIALFGLTIALLLNYTDDLTDVSINKFVCSAEMMKLAAWLLITLCTLGIFCGIAIFFHRALRKLPGISGLLDAIDRRFNNTVLRMSDMADTYASSAGTLTFLTLMSVFFVHLAAALPLVFIIAGIGVEITFSNTLLIISAAVIGNVAGLLPFTPGGIGIRDLTVIILLAAGGIGTGAAETAQLLTTAVSVICNLTGGLFFAFTPGRNKDKKLEVQKLL